MNDYVNDFTNSTKQYFKDLKKYKSYTKEEEKEIFKLIKEGDIDARNKILTANLKFVFEVAKKYKGQGVPLLELISEGNMGLIKAMEKFDTKFDVKFYCYGVWWIKQSIQDYIKKRQINLSTEVSDEINNTKINNEDTEYYTEDETNENLENERIEETTEFDENEKELLQNRKEYITNLLTILDNREKYIIEEYFGFNGECKNLNEIGTELNLTMERVRQIKYNAIQKLRYESMLNYDKATIYL